LRSYLELALNRACKIFVVAVLAALCVPAAASASVRSKLRSVANAQCRRDNQAADGVAASCFRISPVTCHSGGLGVKYCRVTVRRNRTSGAFVVERKFAAGAR
jgi:hypothetical protein